MRLFIEQPWLRPGLLKNLLLLYIYNICYTFLRSNKCFFSYPKFYQFFLACVIFYPKFRHVHTQSFTLSKTLYLLVAIWIWFFFFWNQKWTLFNFLASCWGPGHPILPSTSPFLQMSSGMMGSFTTILIHYFEHSQPHLKDYTTLLGREILC